MDGKRHLNTVTGSSPADNPTNDTSPTSSLPEQTAAALEVADYLLSYGLTVDHRLKSLPLETMHEPRKLVTVSDNSTGLTSSENLPECSIPASVSASEKWEANDNSHAFLSDALKRDSKEDVEGYTRQVMDRRRQGWVRQLKLELPVLRTDEAIDLREYKNDVLEVRKIKYTSEKLPLEPCDDEKDQGLEFPPKACATDKKILRSVEKEKLEASMAAFQTLAKYLKNAWSADDQDALLVRSVVYKGVCVFHTCVMAKADFN